MVLLGAVFGCRDGPVAADASSLHQSIVALAHGGFAGLGSGGRWSGIGGLVNDSPRRQRRSSASACILCCRSSCGLAPPGRSDEDSLGRNQAGRLSASNGWPLPLLTQGLSPRRQSERVFSSKRLAPHPPVRDPLAPSRSSEIFRYSAAIPQPYRDAADRHLLLRIKNCDGKSLIGGS